MDKIFKQLYPGVKEEYLERAFEKLKKNGCPADEDLMVWFGKLVAAEILEDCIFRLLRAPKPPRLCIETAEIEQANHAS